MIPPSLKTKRTLAVLTLALASCRAPIQAVTPTPEIVPLRFVASNTTAPLFQTLASHYQQENALVAFVDQSEIGLSLQQVLDNPSAQPSTYALTTYLDPAQNLWAAPIGQDGIAIISHPDIDIEKLTAAELRQIFTGTITQWSALNTNLHEDIVVVSPNAHSPTRQVFEDLVLGKRLITLNAQLAPSSQAMLEIVANTPGAIGFISSALLDDTQVRSIAIAENKDSPGYLPTQENIIREIYPLRMPLLIVGASPPTPGDGYYEFILWAQTKGQRYIAESYAPLP
jgi:phosphate transport system substrate-binding protein